MRFPQNLALAVAAAEETHLALVVVDVAQVGNPVVFADEAFRALTGLDDFGLLQNPFDLLLKKLSDPRDLTSVETIMDFATIGSWQIACRHSDSTSFPAIVFGSPLRNESGKISHRIYAFVKVGGQVSTMHDQRNEFYALYDQAPGFIAMAEGPEHRFTFANASYKKIRRSQRVGWQYGSRIHA
ncbi:hypothetical protein HHL08_19485 [Sphingobium sp. AR-3-1]|uniref:Uncharacterized protein n=1 Tax=Sphingobium psychrophilum TaxID=2728834 RepID=A0A7X9ZV53_9SPHN|nr:hypothetical protein [Sphingobium psychrophilum]NML12296.1 hypothetical protein [Sphingobium psychrophilum]